MQKIKLINKFLKKLNLELYKFSPRNNHLYRRSLILKSLGIDTVLDIGANIGGYGEELREFGYKEQIISFEPLKEIFNVLEKKCQVDRNWECYNYAIGNEDINKEINVSRNFVSSSFLNIEQKHQQVETSSKFVKTELCSVKPLAIVWSKFNLDDRNIFMKVDTQGFENEVLLGTGHYLNNIKAIQIELSLTKLYSGQKLFDDIYTLLVENGFYLSDVSPGFMDETTGEMLQFDGIFRNRNKLT